MPFPRLAAVLAALWVAVPPAFAERRYEVINLGTLGGGYSSADGINDRGWVVGVSAIPTGQHRAYLWRDGVMVELGVLPGGQHSEANAINNAGWVVGTSQPGRGRAVLWRDGQMTDLGRIFGGVWSTAPDPVDFRDFQRVNIYEPGVNLFVDGAGQPRPLARRQGKPVLFCKPFSDMEVVMGHGGQLGSFEAVFSPRGPDGRPLPLWDRKTGVIDPRVATSWERYDIRLVLERNGKTLAPKLAGKVHLYMGALDTFYLEGATLLLKQSLARLGSDAVVEIFPGKDHGTLRDRALRDRMAREMAAQYRRHHDTGTPR